MINNKLYCPFSNALCRIDCAMIVESMEKKTYDGFDHITRQYSCSIANRGNVPNAALQNSFYVETKKKIDY